MKKIIFLLALCQLMLTGCGQEAVLAEETTAPMATTQTIPETVPETVTEDIATETTQSPPVPEEPARLIETGVHIFAGNVNRTGMLCDGSVYSRVQIRPGEEARLRVESEEAFAGLYLSWDTLPGSFIVRWDGGSLECGGENFHHDFIRLPEETNTAELIFSAEAMLCGMDLYTGGSTPEGVQEWLAPCEQADILVFPTHSDDDVLFFGPLISYYAMERGLDVQTAFLVEHKYQPERVHERLNGLWELGVRHYPILGTAPDTGVHDFQEAMRIYAKSDVPGWQTEQIRRFRPSVVVGHDLAGEYGNGGHKVNAHFLVKAVEMAADPEQYIDSFARYGVWDTPKLYLHLYEENAIILDVNTPIAGDGRTPFQIAEDAFKHHVSQRGGLRVWQGSDHPRYDCTRFGLVRTLVGPDTGSDVMEHIG